MQVRILGPVDVTVGGNPRAVRGLRRKAVLAVLAEQLRFLYHMYASQAVVA